MKKCRILSIDDEEDLRELVRCALSAEYDVDVAADGPEGLAKAKAWRPDLIVCDMMMPGMSGYEVVTALRRDPATECIPVIMLTAINERAKIVEALDSGFDFYIVKPFEIDDLLTKIQIVLKSTTIPMDKTDR